VLQFYLGTLDKTYNFRFYDSAKAETFLTFAHTVFKKQICLLFIGLWIYCCIVKQNCCEMAVFVWMKVFVVRNHCIFATFVVL